MLVIQLKNTKPRYRTDLDRASTALMREDFRNTISSLFLFPKNVSLSQISCSWCSSIPFTGPFCCFCCYFWLSGHGSVFSPFFAVPFCLICCFFIPLNVFKDSIIHRRIAKSHKCNAGIVALWHWCPAAHVKQKVAKPRCMDLSTADKEIRRVD